MLSILASTAVQAYDCVIESTGDGLGNSTNGANSVNVQSSLACGFNASTTGPSTTALGDGVSAAVSSIALGNAILTGLDID